MLPVLRTNFPFSITGSAFNRLDSLFDRFFQDDTDGRHSAREWGSVPVSIWQDEDKLFVEAELPGVSESDVDITVHSGVLTIRANRPQEQGRAYLYNGRTYGRFERAVILPESIDSDHVEAILKNGVLLVTLPKHPEARPKKVTLTTS
jgi:HSP20 family protein